MSNRAREGYVMIDRNILDWKWWQKHNTLIVFMWLLLKANFHESYFSSVKIERGQVATSIENICNHNKLTRQEVKTALGHLKSTGEINITRHSTFLVITIANYDEYQKSNIKSNINQTSVKHQSNINQPHPKNINKTKNTKNTKNPPKPPTGGIDPSGVIHMPDRDQGTYEDIPIAHRDGTYHEFQTYREYWDWRNQ